MPYTHRTQPDGRTVAWAWSSSRDVTQRYFDGPDADRQADKWGRRISAHLSTHTAPNTCGQAARQLQRLCQSLASYGTNPAHSPGASRYWRALFEEATDILQVMRGEPPDAPTSGRSAAVECGESGCDATVWVPARQLWDERQSRREIRRLCPEHARTVADTSTPPASTAAERDELAEAAVGRLLGLAPKVFREPDETMAAWVSIGKRDQLVHAWECNLRLLRYNAGGRAQAWERLRVAMDEADMLHLLDAPPVVEPDPAPGQDAAPEAAPDPATKPQPLEPDDEPELPAPTNPLESWTI